MSGLVRGLVAVPAFLAYAVGAFAVAGTAGLGGVVLLGVGAFIAGYAVGSPWALLVALPFVVAGVVSLDDPGPLENTDSGWGIVILLVLALPVAASAGLGVLARLLVRG